MKVRGDCGYHGNITLTAAPAIRNWRYLVRFREVWLQGVRQAMWSGSDRSAGRSWAKITNLPIELFIFTHINNKFTRNLSPLQVASIGHRTNPEELVAYQARIKRTFLTGRGCQTNLVMRARELSFRRGVELEQLWLEFWSDAGPLIREVESVNTGSVR